MLNNTNNKGFKMALPFLAGLAIGGLAIVAFNNRKKVKSALECGLEKGKEAAKDVKEFATDKFEKISGEVKQEIKKRKRRSSAEVAAEKAAKAATATKKKRAPRAKKAPSQATPEATSGAE